MMNITQILVVIDKEDTKHTALRRAVWLADTLNAELTLLAHTYSESDKSQAELIQYSKTSLDELVAQHGSQLNIQIEVHWQKELHDAVIESMRNKSFDLVIKTTHPHSLVDHILPHGDWHILRQSTAPVMLVKQEHEWSNNRILAAIDATADDDEHSRINDNILSYTEHLADHMEVDLHLVNSCPMVSVAFAMVPEVTAPDNVQGYVTEQHKEACQQWAKKFTIDESKVHIEQGNADDGISHCAQTIEADMVIVGNIGREGLAGLFLGNTAESLVDLVNCDVLVIKPQDGVPDSI